MKNLAPRRVIALAALLCAAFAASARAENLIRWGETVFDFEWPSVSFADLNNGRTQLWFPKNQLYTYDDVVIEGADVPLYRFDEPVTVDGVKRYQAHATQYKATAFKTGNRHYGGLKITLPGTGLQREWRDTDKVDNQNRPQMKVTAPPPGEAKDALPRMPFSELADINDHTELYHFYGRGSSLLKQAKKRYLPLEMLLGDGTRVDGLSLRPEEDGALCTAINRRDDEAIKGIVQPGRSSAVEKLKAKYDDHKALLSDPARKLKFSRLEGEMLWPLTAEMEKADRKLFSEELEKSLLNDDALALFVAKWRKILLAELVVYLEEAAAAPAKDAGVLNTTASLDGTIGRFSALLKNDPEAIKLAAARAETGKTPVGEAGVKDARIPEDDPFADVTDD